MRRLKLATAAIALAAIGPASAQWVPPPSVGPPAPPTAVPSMAGLNLNDNGPGIMAGGIPWMRFNNQGGVGLTAVILGRYAGVNLPNSQGNIFIGALAGASENDGSTESMYLSPWGMPYATGSHANVYIGEHTGGAEVLATACTAVGADVMRDTTGCGGATIVGSGAVIDGSEINDTTVGSGNLHGSAGTIMIGAGIPTPGDVITFVLTSGDMANVTGTLPATVTYTVAAGDTTAAIFANNLRTAIINGIASISWNKPVIPNVPERQKTGVTFALTYADLQGVQYLALHSDGTPTTAAKMDFTIACTGTCAVPVTKLAASTPQRNTLMGRNIMANPGIGSPVDNTLVGSGVAQNASQNFSFNTIGGSGAGLNMSTDTKAAAWGYKAFDVAFGTTRNTGLGYNTGGTVTTGNSNLCLGPDSCNQLLTTGSDNIIITTEVAQGDVDITSRSNLINIGGVVKFQNTSLAAPAVSACGTSPSVDANANNVTGTVTVGTATPTSCTITFAGTGYRVFNHCQVTSQSVNAAFAYSYTKTGITLTGTALAGKVDYWCSGN